MEGRGISLRPLELDDAPALLELRISNRDFLEPFEPSRKEHFYTLEAQREFIEMSVADWEHDDAYAFGVFVEPTHEMIGRIALSNVVRGAWQNATLGYFVAREHTGRGVATESVRLCLEFSFKDAGLHRVQAGVMLRNESSAKVLIKNGFRYEGMSPRYLRINGVWEDHDMYAITAEDYPVGDKIASGG